MSRHTEALQEQGLIPLLSDDVALQCLLRVPVQAHSDLQRVCRRWRDLVSSREFYEHRKKEGTTGHYVCMLQAIPRGASHQAHHPMFSVSIVNERNAWERLPPIPEFHHESLPLFSRFAAVGGSLVVLGGWDPTTTEELRSVYIFSFSSQTWRRGADMPATRSFFSCAALDGTVLVAGGHDPNKNALRTVDRYKLQTNSWESLPSMHRERDECASAVLDGKFFVFSGYATSSQGKFRSDAEVFDPDHNTWTRTEKMWTLGSTAASPTSVIATAGRLFAFHHNQLVCYSTKENAWEVVGMVPEGPRGISTVVCATGFGNRIIVTGSSNEDDAGHITLVYRLPANLDSETGVRCKGAGRWCLSMTNSSESLTFRVLSRFDPASVSSKRLVQYP